MIKSFKQGIIDEQLNWIVGVLEKNKIDYVIDSGTLLGIMREGKLIKWDKDIDITIFEKDTKKISFVLKEAKTKDYKIGLGKYKGLIISYNFSPDNLYYNILYPYIPSNKLRGNRKISLLIIRKKGNFFWSPALFSIGSDKKGFVYYLYKVIRGFKVLIHRIFFKNTKFKLKMTKKRDSLYKYGTHIIPVKYFKKTRIYKNLKIPFITDEYLRYRYGEWKKPVKNWSCIRDDKSFKKESPEEMGFIN